MFKQQLKRLLPSVMLPLQLWTLPVNEILYEKQLTFTHNRNIAISADDFPEQTTPVVAIVPLPNTNNFEGNGRSLTERKQTEQFFHLTFCIDALLGRFFQVLEQKVQDDYAIIYTSSSTKAGQRKKKKRQEANCFVHIDR